MALKTLVSMAFALEINNIRQPWFPQYHSIASYSSARMQEIQTIYRAVAWNVLPPLIQNAITRIRSETGETAIERNKATASNQYHSHTNRTEFIPEKALAMLRSHPANASESMTHNNTIQNRNQYTHVTAAPNNKYFITYAARITTPTAIHPHSVAPAATVAAAEHGCQQWAQHINPSSLREILYQRFFRYCWRCWCWSMQGILSMLLGHFRVPAMLFVPETPLRVRMCTVCRLNVPRSILSHLSLRECAYIVIQFSRLE